MPLPHVRIVRGEEGDKINGSSHQFYRLPPIQLTFCCNYIAIPLRHQMLTLRTHREGHEGLRRSLGSEICIAPSGSQAGQARNDNSCGGTGGKGKRTTRSPFALAFGSYDSEGVDKRHAVGNHLAPWRAGSVV